LVGFYALRPLIDAARKLGQQARRLARVVAIGFRPLKFFLRRMS
jgi:hypothetical protein